MLYWVLGIVNLNKQTKQHKISAYENRQLYQTDGENVSSLVSKGDSLIMNSGSWSVNVNIIRYICSLRLKLSLREGV